MPREGKSPKKHKPEVRLPQKRLLSDDDSDSQESPQKKRKEKVLVKDVISFTCFSPPEKEKLGGTVKALGAKVEATLSRGVTVLVAGATTTEKVAVALAEGIPVVGVSWVEQCEKEGRRVPPLEAKVPVLQNCTVVPSGWRLGEEDTQQLHVNLALYGGRCEATVPMPSLYPAVVLVHAGGRLSEVLQRDNVKAAFKRNIPVVWEGWLADVAAKGHIDAAITQHHRIQGDSSSHIPLLSTPAPSASSWCKAPLAGCVVYLYPGDASTRTMDEAGVCLAVLGGRRCAAILASTTHIVVVDSTSRAVFHYQRIKELLALCSATLPFPASRILTIDWLSACQKQAARVPPERKHIFSPSVSEPDAPPPASALPPPPLTAKPGNILSIMSPASTTSAASTVATGNTPVVAPTSTTGKSSPELASEKPPKELDSVPTTRLLEGCRFIIAPSYKTTGKRVAACIVERNGGQVLRQGEAPEDARGIYYMVPNWRMRTQLGMPDTCPPGATEVTEDWLGAVVSYAKSILHLASGGAPRDEEEDELLRHGAVKEVAARGVKGGEGFPALEKHFMYTTAIQRREVPPAEDVSKKVLASLAGRPTRPSPSPFLTGKLRYVKQRGVGVCVCFSGVHGTSRALMGKAVDLLEGKVLDVMDTHITTHIVCPMEYFDKHHATNDVLVKGRAAAAKGGNSIIYCVDVRWLVASAKAGYFVDEKGSTLFPERDCFPKYSEAPRDEFTANDSFDDDIIVNHVDEAAGEPPKAAMVAKEPTPAKEVPMDPVTPSPTTKLNFDVSSLATTTTISQPTRSRKVVKVCMAITKNGTMPSPPLSELQRMVGKLRGEVVATCKEATHLVVATLGTTEKVCVALASGKWVMIPEWIVESESRGEWVPEGPYEWAEANLPVGTKGRNLAKVAQHWRAAGGQAFGKWVVKAYTEGDAFLNLLRAGGATLVGSDDDPALTHIIIDRPSWTTLPAELREKYSKINRNNFIPNTPLSDQQSILVYSVEYLNAILHRNVPSTPIPKLLWGL